MLRRLALGLAATLLPLAGIGFAAPADAAPTVVTLHYSASGITNYSAQVVQAVKNWDTRLKNVQLVSGGTATIRLHETNGGGSYTNTDGHGHGDIYIDRQQVAQGFDPTRIITHEFGHNLGLPDDYTGPCSEVMSGHGPGTACKNAIPSGAEVTTVDANFAHGFAPATATHTVH